MSDRDVHLPPDDLGLVSERLRAERPLPDGLVLDQVKSRVRARAAAAERRAAHHGKGALLKSRIAITAILALGILMSLSGVGLAVSGFGDSGGAAEVQYSGDDSSTGGLNDPTVSSSGGGSGGDNGSNGRSGSGGAVEAGDVDPASQEAADGGSLAFTGFAAIPVLIGGVALLASGLVLRRRSAG